MRPPARGELRSLSMPFTARDYMSRTLIHFPPDMEILEAVGLLVEKGISGGPVIDRLGNLVGVLAESDCLEAAMQAGYHGSRGGRVRDVMCAEFHTVDVDDSIMDIAQMFRGNGATYARGLPVMKSNRVVGNVSLRDVLRAFQDMARGDK
jgi:CBS domain-containing protein